jgi:integrase/recombinase XerD
MPTASFETAVFDDGLCHGSSGQRAGQAQSQRHRQPTDDGQSGARQGKEDRYTTLSERLLSELRSCWKEHPSPTYLFPNRKGGPISIDYAQRIYNLAKLKAGIQKGHGIHTLRHCFATHLLEAGVDLVTIKTLLGHNSLQSTQRYLQIRQHKLVCTGSLLDLLRFPH